jgi:hypothetical protein
MTTRKLIVLASCVALNAGLASAADVPADVPIVRVPAGAAEAAAAEKPPIQPPRSVYDQAFDDAFKKATEGWLEDPLRYIETDMSHVVGELTAFKTDKPVQQVQSKVVTRLDTIIKMLEKECNGAGGGGGGKPLGRSVIAKGPGGEGDMHDPKQGEKQWASLPPKQREQILQSRTEGFPPGFEAILQSYYERLAQEQLEDHAAATAAPAASPADQGTK